MAETFLGEIRMFAGNFPPMGWAFCHGQTLSISGNDALFSLLGVKYGGDGITTFNLPDLRGRVPVHMGHLGETFHSIGEAGGQATVGLTQQQLPAHSHTPQVYSTGGDCPTPGGNIWADSTAKQFSSANNANAEMADNAMKQAGKTPPNSHENMIPYLAINFIIALEGIYPTRS